MGGKSDSSSPPKRHRNASLRSSSRDEEHSGSSDHADDDFDQDSTVTSVLDTEDSAARMQTVQDLYSLRLGGDTIVSSTTTRQRLLQDLDDRILVVLGALLLVYLIGYLCAIECTIFVSVQYYDWHSLYVTGSSQTLTRHTNEWWWLPGSNSNSPMGRRRATFDALEAYEQDIMRHRGSHGHITKLDALIVRQQQRSGSQRHGGLQRVIVDHYDKQHQPYTHASRRLKNVLYQPRIMPIVQEVGYDATRTTPFSSSTHPNKDGAFHSKPPNTHYPDMATILPKLCSDQQVHGFDSWETLQDAIQEANRLSVQRFVLWSRFFADSAETFQGVFQDFKYDGLYYEEDIEITICPGVTLRARKGPIYINVPNLVLSCEGCMIDVGGSHLSFGPHAKDVVVRGITFRGAKSSSLVFYHSGADVAFEDCYWHDNAAVSNRLGGVADINSTSVVNFFRCRISNARNSEIAMTSSMSVRG